MYLFTLRRSAFADSFPKVYSCWSDDLYLGHWYKIKEPTLLKDTQAKKNLRRNSSLNCPTPPHALYTENLKNEHCVYLHKRISHKLLLNPERNRTLWGHERKRKQIQFKYKFFNLKSYHKRLHYIICLKMHSVTLLQSKTIIMSLHTLYLKLIARLGI